MILNKPYTDKEIKGYENLYFITPDGNIFRQYKSHIRYLKPRIGKNGYIYYDLWKNHKGTRFYLHRLLGEYFLPKIEGKLYINHKDGNKLNNNLENLEWCTSSENCLHSIYILGNKPKKPSLKTRIKLSQSHLGKYKGKENHKSIPIICNETNKIYSCYRECANDIKGTVQGIYDVIHGRYKKHRGLTFSLLGE